MNDDEIQKLLLNPPAPIRDSRPPSVRPVTMVAAFLVLSTLSSYLVGETSRTTFRSIDYWINLIFNDLRISILIGIVFWISLRGGAVFSIERWGPVVCMIASFLIDQWFYPYHLSEYPPSAWLLIYRLVVMGLFFELVRRGLWLKLCPVTDSQGTVPPLRITTLVWLTVFFAMLLLLDWQIRHSRAMQSDLTMQRMPPGLALVSGITRCLVWLSFSLILTDGLRCYFWIGVTGVILWGLSRCGVIYYLVVFHYPANSEFFRPMSMEMLSVLSLLQGGTAFLGSLLIHWTGYRVRVAPQCQSVTKSADISFDAIE